MNDNIDFEVLFEKYVSHIQEMYGHACLDNGSFENSSVNFTDDEKQYFETLDKID